MRCPTLRSLFILPLAFAFVVAVPSLRAQAPVNYQTELDTILKAYLVQETTAPSPTISASLSRNTVTAPADDLVAAVYEYIQKNPGLTEQQVADVAAAAIKTNSANKTRADKDTVAPRIVEAAIIARGAQTNGTLVGLILTTVGNVNSGTTKTLTAAGKQAIIAKAIRATLPRYSNNLSTGVAEIIAAKSDALALTTGTATTLAKTRRDAFTTAVLKKLVFKPQVYDPALSSTSAATETSKGPFIQLNNGAPEPLVGQPLYTLDGVPPSIAGVRDYIDQLFEFYNPVPEEVRNAAGRISIAHTLAEAVATNPAVAGAVIGGLVQDTIKAGGAGATHNELVALVDSTARRPKLAGAIADIVYNGLMQIPNADTQTVGTLLFNTTAITRGKIASGAIRALPSRATLIINQALSATIPPPGATVNPKDVTQAGLPAFAEAAAKGNGEPLIAAEINKAVIAKLQPKATAAADLTAVQAIAAGVIKGVAAANPDAAREVAMSMFEIQRTKPGTSTMANPYSAAFTADTTDTDTSVRAKLAADLAKGASTNYAAAGAAVAGVVKKSTELDLGVTPDLAVTISAAGLKGQVKAAVSIAQRVSAVLSTGTDFASFAAKLALSSASTYAGDIAAGVALTNTTNAGNIVKAVITSKVNNVDVTVNGITTTAAQRAALNKAAFTIAGKVAINIDVEAIGDVAQKVGTLLQSSTNPSNVNLPKLSTLGTLAVSLAKAINVKPQVRHTNRVDELGELAAVLVTASLNVQGGNTPAALAAIGTSIYKAASAKLLANAGNNAADLRDIAGDIAGAIAQTIALAPTLVASGTGGLTSAEKTALLEATGTGSLIKLLSTAAKTFAAQVNTTDPNTQFPGAFNQVRATKDPLFGFYGVVPGNETVGDGIYTYANAKFEIGAIVDPETRIKDL